MTIQFAMKKVGEVYEGALIINGRFARSTNGATGAELFAKLCGPILAAPREDGTEVSVDITVLTLAEIESAATQAAGPRVNPR